MNQALETLRKGKEKTKTSDIVENTLNNLATSSIGFVAEIVGLGNNKLPKGWSAEIKPSNGNGFSEWFDASLGSAGSWEMLQKPGRSEVVIGKNDEWVYLSVGRSPDQEEIRSLTVQGYDGKKDFYLWYNLWPKVKSDMKVQVGNNPMKGVNAKSTNEEIVRFKEGVRVDVEQIGVMLYKTMRTLLKVARNPSLGKIDAV